MAGCSSVLVASPEDGCRGGVPGVLVVLVNPFSGDDAPMERGEPE